MERSRARLERPLLVYDGTCGFCKRWIARWERVIGDRAAYAPSQEVASRFPEIPPSAFAGAVHLIEPDGTSSSGAEAVYRALALVPGRGGWHWAYRNIPGFRALSEGCYRLVARHRPFFSRATDLLWGAHVIPPGEAVTSWIFLRLLGLVFAIAFISLGVQIAGLIGSGGILPASDTLRAIASSESLGGPSRYWFVPTLCWISSSDWFLTGLWILGALLSVMLAFGLFPAPCILLLWAAYLSLSTVCRDFLWFQWDGLLLETAFLGMFLTAWAPRPRPCGDGASARGAMRSLRWLLFRLLFASAAVKLTSGDDSWGDLTALRYHYETQPLPTWLAWYAHQLPLGFHRASTAVTFFVEGMAPFLIFAPRRARFVAAAIIAAHQILIAATGNYGFFNGLTLVLCVLLLDDGGHVFRRGDGAVSDLRAAPGPLRRGGDHRGPPDSDRRDRELRLLQRAHARALRASARRRRLAAAPPERGSRGAGRGVPGGTRRVARPDPAPGAGRNLPSQSRSAFQRGPRALIVARTAAGRVPGGVSVPHGEHVRALRGDDQGAARNPGRREQGRGGLEDLRVPVQARRSIS